MTFPSTRPVVRITTSKNTIQSVDCPELQWWFVVPRANEQYAYAQYDSETLALDRIVTFSATEVESSDQNEVVQIDICNDWSTAREKEIFSPRMRVLATLDAENAKFLAVANLSHDGRVIDEIREGDPYFEEQWGTRGRHLVNNGRFAQQHDGSWRTTGHDGLGEGTYDVTIGDHCFECLRVLDYDENEPFGGELSEAYIERESGRTVYYRQFNGRFYRQASITQDGSQPGIDILAMYPNNARIVIDGELYVHCGCTMRAHDTITLAGLGGFDQ
ncbi:MAG: hypothetical protein OXG15_10030 [Gammaproteobacteria bacterium]|nr:hypothetical protein [Gammaproteobacteria bacterium]